MKTIARDRSRTIVSIKLIAFFSWFVYIVIAIINNTLIEAFLFSMALVAASYLVFGRKNKSNPIFSEKVKYKEGQHMDTDNHNYLSVFFYSAS